MLSSGRGKSTEVLLHGAKKRGSNLGYKQDLSKVDDIWVNSIPLVLILFLVAFVSTMPTSVIIFPFPNILMQGNSHHEASNAKSPHLHWLCVSITQPSDLKPPKSGSQAALAYPGMEGSTTKQWLGWRWRIVVAQSFFALLLLHVRFWSVWGSQGGRTEVGNVEKVLTWFDHLEWQNKKCQIHYCHVGNADAVKTNGCNMV